MAQCVLQSPEDAIFPPQYAILRKTQQTEEIVFNLAEESGE